jgi:hypothetical protein
LRCVDVDEKLAREEKIRNEKEAKKRNNLLYPVHLTNAKSNENISNQNDIVLNSSNTITKSPLKAIKEFSYFDWSKVKLFNKTISDENDENKDIFNRNVSKSLDDSYNYQNIQRFQSDNKKIKDLPQVITIRFI